MSKGDRSAPAVYIATLSPQISNLMADLMAGFQILLLVYYMSHTVAIEPTSSHLGHYHHHYGRT